MYRHEHESSAEWNLRRPFLEAHYGSFDRDRLECLSCCFVNVELYGVSYPTGVMEQLKELAEEVMNSGDVQRHRQRVKDRMEVNQERSAVI